MYRWSLESFGRSREAKGKGVVVRALGSRLVQLSWHWMSIPVAAALVGGAGCAYELSGWKGNSDAGKGSTPTTPSNSRGSDGSTDTDTSAPVASCDNDRLDEGETAIDCGGEQCQPCGLGLSCQEDRDCQSGVCNGVCWASTCKDEEQDGDESDVDCGGSCQPCPDSSSCSVGKDCQSGVCENETCQAPTCDDDVKNGEEADKDCGTEACGLCPNGASCTVDAQCELGVCKNSVCASAQCNDARKNGDETDVDCGGSCPPCAADQVCKAPDDCESRVCVQTSATTKRCAEATCGDNQKNAGESDVDCGGSLCDACEEGAACVVASDCKSRVCDLATATCLPPSCEDDVRNGSELAIDCGGGCPGCPVDSPCQTDADCESNSCVDDICAAPTCVDERKNQDEADVDCGGSCEGCGYGKSCESNADCLSNTCDGTCQRGGAQASCKAGADCRSGTCSSGACAPGYRGAECKTAADCHSGYCSADGLCGAGGLGDACTENSDCVSEQCASSACGPSRFSVVSYGGSETNIVRFDLQVQANAADPRRAWRDIAFVYFFSIISPETKGDLMAAYHQGPNSSDGFLALNPSGTDWMVTWRSNSSDTSNVPTSSSTIYFQVHKSDWSQFTLSNDYSYRSTQGANDKIVICQRVGGRWVHTQGTPPSAIPDPCSWVVDSCDGLPESVECDVLQRSN